MGKGAGSSPNDYAKSLEQKDLISEKINSFFKDFDAWITPFALTGAINHHKTGKPVTVDNNDVSYCDVFIPYNFLPTVTGHPVVVIPIGQTKEGLPVGVQIHGKRWYDYRLLQIAKEIETLTDGFQIPKMFR